MDKKVIKNSRKTSSIEEIVEVNSNEELRYLIKNIDDLFVNTTIFFTNRYTIDNLLLEKLMENEDLKFIYSFSELNKIIYKSKQKYVSFINANNIEFYKKRNKKNRKNIILTNKKFSKHYISSEENYDDFEKILFSTAETAMYKIEFLKKNKILYNNFYNNEQYSKLIFLLEAINKCENKFLGSNITYATEYEVKSSFIRHDYRYENFPEGQVIDIIVFLHKLLQVYQAKNVQVLCTKVVAQNILQFNKFIDQINNDVLENRNKMLKKLFSIIEVENLKEAKVFYSEYLMLIGKSFYNKNIGFASNMAAYNGFSPKGTSIIKLCDFVDEWTIELDNKQYKTENFKTYVQKQTLDGVNFCNVRMISINLYDTNYDDINIFYNNKQIRVWGNNTKNEITIDSILNSEKRILFFDRATKAGDNAEYLYRWFAKNKPEYRNIFFLISRDASDYKRLQEDKFNLIDLKGDISSINSMDFIFTSHIEPIVINPRRNNPNIQYVYLQHGITHHDLSYWFRANPLDYFCLSTREEEKIFENSLILQEHNYLKTGFARHDILYKAQKYDNYVSYFPTWRRQLLQLADEEFMKTDYFLKNKEFLTSNRLKNILKINDHKMRVILHPMLAPKLHLFKALESNLVEILNASEISYEEEFIKAHIGITDISSATYDVAIQDKHILFYVFDRDKLKYNHIYEPIVKEENDIGKYCYSADDLITAIEEKLGTIVDEKSFSEFFKFEKGNACEQIFDRLVNIKCQDDIQKGVNE